MSPSGGSYHTRSSFPTCTSCHHSVDPEPDALGTKRDSGLRVSLLCMGEGNRGPNQTTQVPLEMTLLPALPGGDSPHLPRQRIPDSSPTAACADGWTGLPGCGGQLAREWLGGRTGLCLTPQAFVCESYQHEICWLKVPNCRAHLEMAKLQGSSQGAASPGGGGWGERGAGEGAATMMEEARGCQGNTSPTPLPPDRTGVPGGHTTLVASSVISLPCLTMSFSPGATPPIHPVSTHLPACLFTLQET